LPPSERTIIECKEAVNINVNVQKQTDIIAFCLKVVLIFSFNVCFLTAFVTCLTNVNYELPIIWNIQHFHQRVTSQHTVNANELCTKALLPIQNMYHMWEFIGNK